jgi:hypothetical protein
MVQNFEILDLAMAKVEKVNIADTYMELFLFYFHFQQRLFMAMKIYSSG